MLFLLYSQQSCSSLRNNNVVVLVKGLIATKSENVTSRQIPENKKKYVYVWLSLDDNQWDKDLGGWDYSNVGIRIDTLEVRVHGEKQHENNYELDQITNVIRWRSPKKPDSILAIFGTTESLSSGELTENLERKSKKFRVISYALGALLTTIVAPTAVNVFTDLITTGVNPPPSTTMPEKIKYPDQEPLPELPITVVPSNQISSVVYNSDTPLNQNKAVELIVDYLTAKSDIFGPPYNEELLTRFVHSDGPLYKDATRNLRQLKTDQKRYEYESFEIKASESFVSEKNSLKLIIIVDENSKLYHRDGWKDKGLSNPATDKRIEYEFRKEGEVWKIYDSKGV